MIKIESVELFVYEFRSTGLNYSTWQTHKRNVLIYKVSAQGVSGWGEAAINYKCLNVAKRFAQSVVGKNAEDLEKILDPKMLHNNLLYQAYAGFNRRVRLVREGLSLALWDLCGKIKEQSYAEMMGLKPEDMRPALKGMPVIHVLDPDKMAELAHTWVQEGFVNFKIKLRGNADLDAAAVNYIRSLAPDLTMLIGDANYGYKTVEELEKAGPLLRKAGLQYLQNPIRIPIRKYRDLSTKLGIPFTCDNTAYWPQVRRVLHLKAADLVNLHPNVMGGVDYLHKTVNAGKDVIMGSSGCIGIQDKAYQKIAFGLPTHHPTENVGLQSYFTPNREKFYQYEHASTSILENDLLVQDGMIHDRYEHGFGVTPNPARLEDGSIQKFSFK